MRAHPAPAAVPPPVDPPPGPSASPDEVAPVPPAAAAGTPAPAPIVITPMRRRHLRQVLRIDHAVYPRPWSLGLYLGELASDQGRSYLVARRGATVVGFAGVIVIVDDAHVTTIAVAPAHQREGVATRLLLVLVREAVALGASRITLEVRASNTPAQALYRRFGFAPAGIRRGYYVDNREDALVMWTDDVRTPEYRARLDRIEAGCRIDALVQGVRP